MSSEELLPLIEKSGFVFRGKVLHERRTDERHVPAGTGWTEAVEVEEILLGTEVLRGLAGKEVIVIGDKAEVLERGDTLLFFTNCLVLADHALVREVGHLKMSHEVVRDVEQALKMAAERPLRQRIAAAELIIVGQVSACAPLEPGAPLRSEHDPEWWVARVAISLVLKGGKTRKEIDVAFAHSTDIAWYKAPKLYEGDIGVLILRRFEANTSSRVARSPLFEAIDPFDFLPEERLHDVRRLLGDDLGGAREER